jgi:hypothetical protein
MMLRVVLQLLGDGGVAEEEGESGENVLTGGRESLRSGQVLRELLVGGRHVWMRG